MLSIDILTIMFVLAIFNLLAAFFFILYLRLTQSKTNLSLFILSKSFQGLSWLMRLLFYKEMNFVGIVAADLFLLFGFAMESALFVSFKGKVSNRLRFFYSISLGLITLSVFAFSLRIPAIKDLLILVAYITYMYIISWKLIMTEGSTNFQRLIGITYGTLPLISSIMFIAITKEVTIVGQATSLTGILYYISILFMQLIGGVGYLLMVNEHDERVLKETSIKDPLTGILNRRAFYEYATRLTHKAIRDNTQVSVVMIDVDHFKQINDSKGHIYGDKVLRFLCDALAADLRKEDILARFGGEEFIILISVNHEDAVHTFVNRLHNDLHEKVTLHADDITPFTISMGVYTCLPSESNALENMVKYSDDALYHSKQNGRDQATLLQIIEGEHIFIRMT